MMTRNTNLGLSVSLLLLFCSYIVTFAQSEWTKYGDKPVVLPTGVYPDWDGGATADPSVILDGDTLKMWYTGVGWILPDTTVRCRIGYATSTNGTTWTKYSDNPVLNVGTTEEWDGKGIETVCVIKDTVAPDSERYKMWYYGENFDYTAIGYAYSADGINWTKYTGNPVLLPGTWGSWDEAVCGPSVIKDYDAPPGERYKMWYTGSKWEVALISWSIGYATSPDGINWTPHPNNPILTEDTTGAWDTYFVCEPSVIKTSGIYEMWYSGAPGHDSIWQPLAVNIGYATSTNGIEWTKHGLVLEHGAPGKWDAWTTAFPTVILEDSFYKMWYTGIDGAPPHITIWAIGYAWAPLPGPRKGDVNGDGLINIVDVVRAINIILEIEPPPTEYELWAADCNGDGDINLLDVVGIVNVILSIGSCEG